MKLRTVLFPISLFLILLTAVAMSGPLSERILFVAEYQGLKKLFWCRPDGRDLQRFCKEPGNQTQVCHSPVLGRVFFVRPNRKRISEICSVNEEGKDFRIEIAERSNAIHPSISPDGRKLLFSSDKWGAFELCEMDLESREIERLTYDANINTCGRYSPDGKSVVFLSRRKGLTEIYTLRLADQSLDRLTRSAFAHGEPTWNPEGSRILGTVNVPPRRVSTLIEKDLSSGTLRRLLPHRKDVKSPCYSPDGDSIIFVDDEALYTFDLSDVDAEIFPIKGDLVPEEVLWISYPLP